jgi:dTDP-4-amino-4,6-dideoxy-D-galactose acyltransferase
MSIEYLQWDSGFFNKKIGRVNVAEGEVVDVEALASEARQMGYRLLYIFSGKELKITIQSAGVPKPELVDRKVVYDKVISPADRSSDSLPEYTGSNTTKELEELAYLSGGFSRFHLDANFTDDDFHRLYNAWISKSVSKEMADHVFVAEESGRVVGMVTLKASDGVGHIGLIAVSSETQSKGYGKKLINTCFNALLDKGVSYIEVPTQLANIQACRFYEKCGFQVKSITYIYHLGIVNSL